MEKKDFSKQVHDYIKLISLYFNNKEAASFEIEKSELLFFYQLSKRHSLRALFYLALRYLKTNVDSEFLQKLENYYLLTVQRDVLFERERKELYQYLNDNKISFLPLKGIVIRNFYPDPHSREYADNDILFFDKDDAIKKFFVNREYTVEVFRESEEDVYLKKPYFNFEMHRALFGDNARFISYFKDTFNRALVKDKCERYLTDEDFYIYFTAHTYKHFHVSGCGLRTLIDYYLYLKNKKLDFDYINKKLTKIGLLDFSNDIKSLSLELFDNEPLNEKEEEMLLFIASSGTYGTLDNRVEKGVKEKGKFRYFMSRVFPPYSYYKMPYPWAYYCPILIPLAWFICFLKRVFRDPKRASSELKMISKKRSKK